MGFQNLEKKVRSTCRERFFLTQVFSAPESSALPLTQRKDNNYYVEPVPLNFGIERRIAINCRLRAANCQNPRSPSRALALVLSPATPRAAVCGRRGTVARPRVVGWRSGAAGVKTLYSNRNCCEDRERDDDDVSVIYTW